MKLKPIFDRLIVKEIKPKENKTKSGIILPNSVKEAPNQGKVIAINTDNCDENGIKSGIKKGDIVLYPSYSALEFCFEDEIYSILKQSDVLCKIEKEDK